MRTETFKGTIETAFGQKVVPAIDFSGSYEAYENYSEVPQSEKLTEKDMLNAVNNARKASARASEITKLTEAYKPDEKTAAVNTLVKTLMKLHGLDEATARGMVESIGGAVAK